MSFPLRKFRVLFLAVLIALSLGIFAFHSLRPHESAYLPSMIRGLVLPVQYLIKSSISDFLGIWDKYIFLIGRQEENQQLVAANALLRDQLTGLTNENREYQLELHRLRRLMSMAPPPGYRTVTTRVLSRVASPLSDHIFIDQGLSHGLEVGLPVATEAGLVGRIVQVSPHVSKVMLITDRLSRVDALTQEGRVNGILQGQGYRDCVLKYIPRDVKVGEGETIVTAGLSGFFPKGMIIGRVSRVQMAGGAFFQEIYIQPAVDMSQLEEVLVLLPQKRGGRQ